MMMSFASLADYDITQPVTPASLAGIHDYLVNTGLPQLSGQFGGDWQLVWGPALHTWPNLNLKPDSIDRAVINVVFVAQNAATNEYTVGIAGTDFKSIYDWLAEDCNVAGQKSWLGNPANGMLSDGTHNSLALVLGLQPPNGPTLQSYLQSIATISNTIYVSGHSLGGALSTVIALWIVDAGGNGADLSQNVWMFDFAGPSPGDATFSSYFSLRLPNAQRYWNEHDVVPHAWAKSTMLKVPDLYNGVSPFPDALKAVTYALAETVGDKYEQVLPNAPSFAGDLQPHVSYGEQIVYQHICAYYLQFGLNPPSSCTRTL